MTNHPDPIRVVLATDSFLLGDGLASILAGVDDIDIVGRARDHYHLLRLVDELHPDAIVYGIRTSVISTMPTISVARHLRGEYPDMGFVVISDRANGFATELLRGGASRVAYLLDHQLPSVGRGVGRAPGGAAGGVGPRPQHRGLTDRPGRGPSRRRAHPPGVRCARADGPRTLQPGHRHRALPVGQGHREGHHVHLPQARTVRPRTGRSSGLGLSGATCGPRPIRSDSSGGPVVTSPTSTTCLSTRTCPHERRAPGPACRLPGALGRIHPDRRGVPGLEVGDPTRYALVGREFGGGLIRGPTPVDEGRRKGPPNKP